MKDFLEKFEEDNLTENREFLFNLNPSDEPAVVSEKKLYVYWTYESVRSLMINENLSISDKIKTPINSKCTWREAFALSDIKERNATLLNKASSLTTSMFVTNFEGHNDRKKEILKILRDIDEREMKLFLSIKAKEIILNLKKEKDFDIKDYATSFVMETMQFLIGNCEKEVFEAAYTVYKYFFTFNKSAIKSLVNNQKIIFIVKKLIEKYDNDPDGNSLWSKMKVIYNEKGLSFDIFIADVIAVIGAAMESSVVGISNQLKYCFDLNYHFKEDYLDDEKITNFISQVNLLEPSVNYVVRFVSTSFTYKNIELKEGDKLFLLIPFANREALQKMGAHPDGKSGCHFGRGRHYCIGSEVAEVEMFVALREVINEFKNVKVDIICTRAPNIKFRNFTELKLRTLSI